MEVVHSCFLIVSMVLGLNAHIFPVNKSLFKRQTTGCSGTEFYLCSSGECLAKYNLCDSRLDCADKSDETAEICKVLYNGRCRHGYWRCTYGACINQAQHCDMHDDCWDKSDEENCSYPSTTTQVPTTSATDTPTSSTTEPEFSAQPCEIPKINNTVFYTWYNQLTPTRPGTMVAHDELLLVGCNSGQNFELEAGRKGFTVCQNGHWSRTIPQCAVCGVSNLDTDKEYTLVSGHEAKHGLVPWYASLYHYQNGRWAIICAGTLISRQVVLTAAYCLTTKSSLIDNVEDLSVSLGKHICNWIATEDNEQRFDVKEVVFHPGFRLGSNVRTSDIALLLLASEVEINTYVMPACIDYMNIHTLQVANDKTLYGTVAGWNITWSDQLCKLPDASDPLLYSRLPLLSREEIYQRVVKTKKDHASMIPKDLFVATNGTDAELYMGAYGGGLTVPFNGRHYVYGIYVRHFKFSRIRYGAFMNISYHVDWLRRQMEVWS